MRILYYRNLNPEHFFSETDFNLSSEYQISTSIIETNSDLNYLTVKISCKKNNDNIFAEDTFISDAKIIVGENGSGKSTLIDQIFKFVRNQVTDLSEQILIGDDFVLIGDKIKIESESFDNLRSFFPSITLYCKNTETVNRNIRSEFKQRLTYNQSYIQQQAKTSNYLFFYNNSIDSNRINSFRGKLVSSGQLAEEGVSLHDISDLNEIIISNQWGFKSSLLQEYLGQNNLISYDDYEIRKLLDLIYQRKIDLSILPNQILNKLKISIHFGSLTDQFFEYVLNVIPINDGDFPFLSVLITPITDNNKSEFFRQLLMVILIKTIDTQIESSKIEIILNYVFEQFEESLHLLDPILMDEPILSEKLEEIILVYLKSKTSIFTKELFDRANELFNFCLKNERTLGQMSVNGFRNEGIILNFKEFQNDINSINLLVSRLQEVDNFRVPFIQFSSINLSTGERHMLYLLTRISYSIGHINPIIEQPIKKICLVMDEPNNSYHPNWQKQFFNILYEYFKKINESSIINIQLIISTHSPFLLSDFSKPHVLRIGQDGESGKTVIIEGKETFGANIHDLLADEFFMTNGFMGDFAKNKIDSLIDYLKSPDTSDDWNENNSFKTINLIGEDLIRQVLLDLYYIKFTDKLDQQIEHLNSLKKYK